MVALLPLLCLAEDATTNHRQALQRRAVAGNESVTTWIVGHPCPSLAYHQIIVCWLTLWLTAQPRIKVGNSVCANVRGSCCRTCVGGKEGEGVKGECTSDVG